MGRYAQCSRWRAHAAAMNYRPLQFPATVGVFPVSCPHKVTGRLSEWETGTRPRDTPKVHYNGRPVRILRRRRRGMRAWAWGGRAVAGALLRPVFHVSMYVACEWSLFAVK